MSLPPDVDPDTLEWIGTCPKCSTSHRGHLPGTLAADAACLSVLLRQTGSALAEPFDDFLRTYREHGWRDALRALFGGQR
jgi:hypothetical protein